MKLIRHHRARTVFLTGPLTLLVWALLAGPILATGAKEAQPAPLKGEAREAVIGVVAMFQKKTNRQLVTEMNRQAGQNSKSPRLRFEPFYTLGEAEAASRIGEELKKPGVCGLIFLDAASARLSLPGPKLPVLTVVPSREVLAVQNVKVADGGKSCPVKAAAGSPEENLIKPGTEAYPDDVLETTPQPEAVMRAIASLRPLPARIGIVYTMGAPGNESFLREFKRLCKQEFQGKLAVQECRLEPGACRNTNDIESALEDSFGAFGHGSLLLALPSTNTLKFAFLFHNFASRHGLGLVSLGEEEAEGFLISIFCAPGALAGKCLETAGHWAAKAPAPRLSPTPPQVAFSPTLLKQLGYSVNPARGR